MKQSTLLLALINILLLSQIFTSCKKETLSLGSPIVEEFATAKGGGNPNTPPTTYLRVTISDDAGNKITSDGGGDYLDGVGNIRAQFDNAGNFQFNTRLQSRPNQTTPLTRYIKFNFDSPLEGYPVNNPPISGDPNLDIGDRLVTIGSSLIPATPIQTMTVGSSQCITLHGGTAYSTKTEPAPAWGVNFHRNYDDVAGSPTSFAVITRNSETQWTMVPGNCAISSNSDVAALRNGETLYGYYHLPFSITLTKL